MIENNINFTSLGRIIRGRVAFYEGATLKQADYNTNLIDIKVDRVGEENKFYGFGVMAKATITIQDKNREININDINNVSVLFSGVEEEYIAVLSNLKVIDSKRDENNNNITLICCDNLIDANTLTVNELGLNGEYYIDTLIEAIADKLNVSGIRAYGELNPDLSIFREVVPDVANLNGTEKLRDILDDFAEFYMSIYFINANNELEFRFVTIEESAVVLDITKNDYFTLKVGNKYTLSTMTHTTVLGENLSYCNSELDGETQILRDNCFLDNNPNTGYILESLGESACSGIINITDFTCSWRGNCFLETGDIISLTTKDNDKITVMLINDSYLYNGGLKGEISCKYNQQEAPAANPTNIGEAIKQTYARVDKVNKEITLLASDTNANKEAIAQIQVNTNSITSSVKTLEENTKNSLDTVSDNIAELDSKITQSAEDIRIEFTSKLDKEVDSVTTSTGFTFNEEGLTVSKSGSEMETTITEDGMVVYRNDEAMLTADNTGVDAVNLRATTYLIIGNNSRFEDMGSSRTGCFWIGG